MNRTSRRLATGLLCLGLFTAACGDESDDGEGGEPTPQEQQTEQSAPGDAPDDPAQGQEQLPGPGAPETVEVPEVTSATIHTSEGDIALTLYPEEAPLTVTNFAGLADGSLAWSGQEGDEPLYDGTIFHRVIDGFMIQGGDPAGNGTGGPGYQFADEVDTGLTFEEPYLLAMANSGPATNGSQFFITVEPTPHLNGLHTIFGEVADDASREVVDAIAATETGPGDVPVEPITIESVSLG
ncbi:peptidylprolyl isomerase [Streptomyces sp. PT12]|nr:peptidylprolyl isomerase [Streptomyces sp. PT12]